MASDRKICNEEFEKGLFLFQVKAPPAENSRATTGNVQSTQRLSRIIYPRDRVRFLYLQRFAAERPRAGVGLSTNMIFLC